jgi:hypothetical protein
MFRDNEVQGFLHCSFALLFHCFFSSLLVSIVTSLLQSHIVARLLLFPHVVTPSHCCLSMATLVLLFAFGSSLALLFVYGYSFALLFVCHCVVNGPSSHNYWSYVTPSHSYYCYVVIPSTSSTMPNPLPIRFVIVVLLCYCCSMCLVSKHPPNNNLLVQVAMECGIQPRRSCKL